MHYMVILVIDDSDQCPDVMEAWIAAGAPGITILESTGFGRMGRELGLMDNTPLMPSLRQLFAAREQPHRTIFSVVEGDTAVDALIDASQRVLGDLSLPHTGVLFAVPLARVVGGLRRGREQETS